ncbi:MAG: class B sortase [Clostridia bacterium]|nr:class B sortase [Clostridia bacterium]
MKDNRRIRLIIAIILCAAVLSACGAYLIYNYVILPRRIAADNQHYAEMYNPDATAQPTAVPQPVLEAESTLAPAGPDDVQLGTPGPDTLVYAASTLPPVQESFAELLGVNPETAAFLQLGKTEGLPVVQRENDNEYYLTHSFDDTESDAGCLFIDGANWLFPRDECLYVYGHNMKNGEMFGRLTRMSTVDGLIERSPVYFDTIYEDGIYVPFACFALSADDNDNDYFRLRRFTFTEESFNLYTGELKKRSILDIPVDAVYGDKLLILVTCNYSIDDGRFAVACRQLREDETAEGAMRLVKLATEK